MSIWNIKSLFSLKFKAKHVTCRSCEGLCGCSENYIREIERNFETRKNEHRNPKHLLEPTRHSLNNANQYFTWKIYFISRTCRVL